MKINIGTSLDPSYGGISKYLSLISNDEDIAYDISLFGLKAYPNQLFFKKISLLSFIVKSVSKLKNTNKSVVVFHGLFTIYPIIIPVILDLFVNVDYEIYPHGMLYNSVLKGSNSALKRTWLCIANYIIKRFNITIICLSVPELNEANSNSPNSKKVLIPPRIYKKPDELSLNSIIESKFNTNNYIFSMLCRFSPEKQIDLVIRAFASLSLHNCVLNIYGDSSINPAYFQYCRSLSSSHQNILLHQFIDEHQVQLVLKKSHFCIIFSTKENFSLTLVEASLSGNIIITNSNVGASHFFQQDSIFSSDFSADLSALTDLITSAITHTPADLKAIARRSSLTALTQFTF